MPLRLHGAINIGSVSDTIMALFYDITIQLCDEYSFSTRKELGAIYLVNLRIVYQYLNYAVAQPMVR